MERVVKTFASHEEADAADIEIYRRMTGQQKLDILVEMITPDDPKDAVMQRTVKVYPLAQYRRN